MPKHSNKKKTSTKKKTSNKRNQYAHVKTGQTVTLKNGACAKRQSNGQFRFVKRTSCKKSKKGGGPGKVPISEEQKRENAKQQFLEKYGISEDDFQKGHMFEKKLGNEGIIEWTEIMPTNLRSMLLSDNQIGDEGMIALAKNLPSGLTQLYIADNIIGNDGVIALAENLPEGLRRMSIDGNKIGDKGAKILASKLPKTLKTLHIEDNNISDPVKDLISLSIAGRAIVFL